MGRPRIYGDREQIQIRLPAETHGRLKAAADERVVSMNLLVANAVESYLDALAPLEDVLAVRS